MLNLYSQCMCFVSFKRLTVWVVRIGHSEIHFSQEEISQEGLLQNKVIITFAILL